VPRAARARVRVLQPQVGFLSAAVVVLLSNRMPVSTHAAAASNPSAPHASGTSRRWRPPPTSHSGWHTQLRAAALRRHCLKRSATHQAVAGHPGPARRLTSARRAGRRARVCGEARGCWRAFCKGRAPADQGRCRACLGLWLGHGAAPFWGSAPPPAPRPPAAWAPAGSSASQSATLQTPPRPRPASPARAARRPPQAHLRLRTAWQRLHQQAPHRQPDSHACIGPAGSQPTQGFEATRVCGSRALRPQRVDQHITRQQACRRAP